MWEGKKAFTDRDVVVVAAVHVRVPVHVREISYRAAGERGRRVRRYEPGVQFRSVLDGMDILGCWKGDQ